GGDGQRIKVERIAGVNVYGGADAAFLEIRLRTLVHLQFADDFRRKNQVIECTCRAQLIEDEPVRRRDIMTVEQRLGEVRGRASDAYAFAFSKLPVDYDTGNPLKSFRDVLVRKLANVLGAQDVGDDRRIALGPDRCLDRPAETRDDN